MVIVDRRSKALAEVEDDSDNSTSSYEWVTDSDESDVEVTDDMVNTSMATTLLSMVPFTKAYKEANNAMYELNDVQHMQAEVAHCKDLKEQLSQGLHESALRTMKDETIMDFSDFNKTKAHMVLENSWFYETQRQKMQRLEKAARASAESGQGEFGTNMFGTHTHKHPAPPPILNQPRFYSFSFSAGEKGSGAEGHAFMKLRTRSIFDHQRKWDMDHSTTDFQQEINWSGHTKLEDDDDNAIGVGGVSRHQGCKWR